MTARRRQALGGDALGAAGLEFAFGGLMILMMIFVIFDIGLILFDQCGLDYGADVAARWGATNSATATVATLLAQFRTATFPVFGTTSNSCLGYSTPASVPAGTACYIVVTFSSGAEVGSVVTVKAYWKWTPVAPFDGFAITTLQSIVSVTIEN